MPITVVILIGLFVVQRRGTARRRRDVRAGHDRLVRASSRVLGVMLDRARPARPRRDQSRARRALLRRATGCTASSSSARSSWCVTGGEALYADMGHFGARPIRIAWFALVLPALLLNYFGQGALLLHRSRRASSNPFFQLAPAVGALSAGRASRRWPRSSPRRR